MAFAITEHRPSTRAIASATKPIAAAGLAHLRFTHWQVRYDTKTVQRTLKAVAARRRQATSAISGPP